MDQQIIFPSSPFANKYITKTKQFFRALKKDGEKEKSAK